MTRIPVSWVNSFIAASDTMRWSPRSSNPWGSRKVSVTASAGFRQPTETDDSKTAATAGTSLSERRIQNRIPWMMPLLVPGTLNFVAIWATHRRRSQFVPKSSRGTGRHSTLRGICTPDHHNRPSSFWIRSLTNLVRQAKRSSSYIRIGPGCRDLMSHWPRQRHPPSKH